MEKVHRVVLVGLGATGVAIGRSLRERSDCRLVGAVDIDPGLAGRDLGAILDGSDIGVRVEDAVHGVVPADAAVIATSSSLESIEPAVTPLLEAGINVVSICEELSYPHSTHPALAARLDRVARRNGVSLLGTGCNPGMVMDTIPLLLSGLTQRVDRVEIQRAADMSRYGAILAKFGLGLTTEEFTAAAEAGRVTGHVGFAQSVGALAAGLGWQLDAIEIDPVQPEFLAPVSRHGRHIEVRAGTVAAVRHAARGRIGARSVIDLAIYFGFFQRGDPVQRGDRCRIIGSDQELELVTAGGYESFLSTVSVVGNTVTAVVDAEPGLRTMAELTVGAIASKGGRLAGSAAGRVSTAAR